ncbi:MAG: hypothetical protein EBQ95_07315 [Gammaproteobacteria bacterium]|nr:hypothetical protein [Gammaproteobacteria bacterium]
MYICRILESTDFQPFEIQNQGCVHLRYNKNFDYDHSYSFYLFYDKTNSSDWYIRLSTQNPDEALYFYPETQISEYSMPTNLFLNDLWAKMYVTSDMLNSPTLMRFMLDKFLTMDFWGQFKANLEVLSKFESSMLKIEEIDRNIDNSILSIDLFEHLSKEISCERTLEQKEKLIRILFILNAACEDEVALKNLINDENLKDNGEYNWKDICNHLAFDYKDYQDLGNRILTEELLNLIQQRHQNFKAAAFWHLSLKADLQFKNSFLDILFYVELIAAIICWFVMLLAQIFITNLLIQALVLLGTAILLGTLAALLDSHDKFTLDWLLGDQGWDINKAIEVYAYNEPHIDNQGMKLIKHVNELFVTNLGDCATRQNYTL